MALRDDSSMHAITMPEYCLALMDDSPIHHHDIDGCFCSSSVSVPFFWQPEAEVPCNDDVQGWVESDAACLRLSNSFVDLDHVSPASEICKISMELDSLSASLVQDFYSLQTILYTREESESQSDKKEFEIE